jgi:hypothetical protein
MRPLSQLDVELLPSWLHTTGEPRYIGPAPGSTDLLFAAQDATTFGVTLRSTYTFAPTLSLQAYAQLFLAAARYRDFASHPAAREIRLADLTPAAAPTTRPDLHDGALNLNLVLRWEYALGSAAYLVYTRAQAPQDPTAADASLPLTAVYRGRADDVVMLKASYFWQ